MSKKRPTEEEVRYKFNEELIEINRAGRLPSGRLPLSLIRQYKSEFDVDRVIKIMMGGVNIAGVKDKALDEFFDCIPFKGEFIKYYIEELSVDFMNKHRDLFIKYNIVSSPRIPENIIREIFESNKDSALEQSIIKSFEDGMNGYKGSHFTCEQYSEELAIEFINKIDIHEMAKFFKLTEDIIDRYVYDSSIARVLRYQKLSEAHLVNLLENRRFDFCDDYNICALFKYQELSEEFIDKNKHHLNGSNHHLVMQNRTLSDDFLIKLFNGGYLRSTPAYLPEYHFSEKVLKATIKNESLRYSALMNFSKYLPENFVAEHIDLAYDPYAILEKNVFSEKFLKEFMLPYLMKNDWRPIDFMKSVEFSDDFLSYLIQTANLDDPMNIVDIIEYVKINDNRIIWPWIRSEAVAQYALKFCILSDCEIDAIIKIHPNLLDGKIRKVLSHLTFSMCEDIAPLIPCRAGIERYLKVFKADEKISWNTLLRMYPRKHISDVNWFYNTWRYSTHEDSSKMYDNIYKELF